MERLVLSDATSVVVLGLTRVIRDPAASRVVISGRGLPGRVGGEGPEGPTGPAGADGTGSEDPGDLTLLFNNKLI